LCRANGSVSLRVSEELVEKFRKLWGRVRKSMRKAIVEIVFSKPTVHFIWEINTRRKTTKNSQINGIADNTARLPSQNKREIRVSKSLIHKLKVC